MISIWRVRSLFMNVRIGFANTPVCLPLRSPSLPPYSSWSNFRSSFSSDYSGACEGSVACSTCHVILPEEYYNLLPEPEDDENDMLDMAFGLTDTSRLGCQVKVTRELDGITCTLPSATRNMFVDGMCLFDIFGLQFVFSSCPIFIQPSNMLTFFKKNVLQVKKHLTRRSRCRDDV